MKNSWIGGYEEYKQCQVDLTRKKITVGKVAPWSQSGVIEGISKYVLDHVPSPGFGICHGVRRGHEVEEFRRHIPGRIIGTELCEEAIMSRGVRDLVHWDFNVINPEWVCRADFVYSNSLDHSDRPLKTLEVWVRQLALRGLLFVEWTVWHNRSDNPADCFCATREEYELLISLVANVKTILEFQKNRGKVKRHTFVIVAQG